MTRRKTKATEVKDVQINLRIDRLMAHEIDELAGQEDRPASYLVRQAIREYLDRRRAAVAAA